MEEKEFKALVKKSMIVLLVAYNVDSKKEILDKWINIIESATFWHRKKVSNKFMQDVLKEVLENYTYYRTVNASVYLTAYRKIYNKNNPF